MRNLSVSLLLGVVSLAVSACGSNGGGAPSKKEYIAKAEAICKDADRKETQAGAPGGTSGPIAANVLDAVVAIDGKALADLRKLEAPGGDADAVAKIVADLKAVHSTRKAEVAALHRHDSGAATDARNSFYTASSDLGVSAGGYGLTSCQALGF